MDRTLVICGNQNNTTRRLVSHTMRGCQFILVRNTPVAGPALLVYIDVHTVTLKISHTEWAFDITSPITFTE